MSVSPILAEDGSGIGVVSVSRGYGEDLHTESGPNSRLSFACEVFTAVPINNDDPARTDEGA